MQVLVPDVGEADDIEVIEVLVKVGDVIAIDDSLVVLESEKASMEIPSPVAGQVKSISVNEGDKVETGHLLLEMEQDATADNAESQADEGPAESAPVKANEPIEQRPSSSLTRVQSPDGSSFDGSSSDVSSSDVSSPGGKNAAASASVSNSADKKVHAGPAVRKQAREYGIDLTDVKGTGQNQRILKEDIQAYVKQRLASKASESSAGMGIPPIPDIDFSRYGEIELRPMSRIKKATAKNLHRSWLNVPHVTQFDEADITALEEFRKAQNTEMASEGIKLTPLAFMIKACVSLLIKFPQFNASLESGYSNLILKKYYNIGVAVETPEGLVVPVLKDADKKGLVELGNECAELARLARDKKLPLDAMQGATFTISSLGGIGGTQFTPIVNAPEVAILGVSKSKTMPVWDGQVFQPRIILPLSLSYDHRAIDGAEGARFTQGLAQVLADVRRLLL